MREFRDSPIHLLTFAAFTVVGDEVVILNRLCFRNGRLRR